MSCTPTKCSHVNCNCKSVLYDSRLNPNAIPFSPNQNANVTSSQANTHILNPNAKSFIPIQKCSLNPNAVPFVPSKKSGSMHSEASECSALKVFCMNIKSVGEKLCISDNQKQIFSNDIIMISETWLSKKPKLSKIQIPGFKEKNLPRPFKHRKAKRDSGGILLYNRRNLLRYTNIVKVVCDHFVVLEIRDILPSTTYIIFTYVPPEDTTYICKGCDNNYFDCLSDLVVAFSSKGNVVICGDLNARTGNLTDCPEESMENEFVILIVLFHQYGANHLKIEYRKIPRQINMEKN